MISGTACSAHDESGSGSTQLLRAQRASSSSRFDLDLVTLALEFRRFGQRNLEDALVELGVDLRSVGPFGHAYRALERTVAPLGELVMLLLLITLRAFFAADGQGYSAARSRRP